MTRHQWSRPGVLTGLAVGDALGMPFEATGSKVHKDLADWDGNYRPGTWHKLPAGHWTDDTEMATALAETIIENKGYSPIIAAQKYLRWSLGTPHGMGGTIRKAMERLAEGVAWNESGVVFAPEDSDIVGNGTAMRIAPMGLAYRLSLEGRPYLSPPVCEDAMITHKHNDAYVGALVIAELVSMFVDGMAFDIDPDDYLEVASNCTLNMGGGEVQKKIDAARVRFPYLTTTDHLQEVIFGVGRSGNVSSTVASAVLCSAWGLRHNSFEQAVVQAIKGGGDTDTRGAITGALMGAAYGLDEIPERYREGLLEYDKLANLDSNLYALRASNFRHT